MHRRWWLGPVLAAGFCLPLSCHGNTDTAPPSSSTTSGLGGGVPDGGGVAGTGGGGGDGAGLPGGGGVPVYLGLTANAAAADGGPPSPADQALAEMTVLATGVRAVFVTARWDQLDSAGLTALEARVADYTARDLHVVLSLLDVDARAAYPPSAIGGTPWVPSSWQVAFDATLDAVVGAVGPQLDGLVLGRDVDVYLDANPSEAAALVGFTAHAMAHLDGVGAPPRAVGVRYSAAPLNSYGQQLAGLGELLAISYLPGIGQASLPADISPANDLDAVITLAGGRPVVLQAVGFPSSVDLASSEATQRQLLQSFFAALLPRASAFPWVNVRQLQDLGGSRCDDLAAGQGLPPTDAEVRYLCSAGLRSSVQQTKEAWPIFVAASAQLAVP